MSVLLLVAIYLGDHPALCRVGRGIFARGPPQIRT
jgi:hypothetical protein